MNVKEYVEKMKAIKEKRLLSMAELCREIMIGYYTMIKIYDTGTENERKLSYRTLRKIKDFVEKHQNVLQ
jgi:hypothetical protein